MKRLQLLAVLLICAVCCPILRATEFDDASDKAKRFLSRYEEIRSLHPKQIQALVATICGNDGDEDDFKTLSREATEKLRDDVRENIEDLNKLHEDAAAALRRVQNNPELKDKQSDARKLSERIDEIWIRIQNIYAGEIRGGNNPVVAYMAKMGQESHEDYRDHSGKCTVFEFETGEGRADCLWSEKCYVIELKPNNNRAVSKGKSQAEKYAGALNANDDDSFTNLLKKTSDFDSCKGKFVPKVVTYISCPEIDSEGNVRSSSYGWSDPE